MSELLDEFDINFTNINGDIGDIDSKLANLSEHIESMEMNVSRLKQIIADPKTLEKSKYYSVLNSTMETLSLYYNNFEKYLELKFKYRKETNDLKTRILFKDGGGGGDGDDSELNRLLSRSKNLDKLVGNLEDDKLDNPQYRL